MKIRTLAAAGFVGLALTFVGNQAFATSPTFNCNKATKPSEHLICADDGLAQLENDFVGMYYETMNWLKTNKRYSDRRKFKSRHRSNIYAVEACGADAICIENSYNRAIGDYAEYRSASH